MLFLPSTVFQGSSVNVSVDARKTQKIMEKKQKLGIELIFFVMK